MMNRLARLVLAFGATLVLAGCATAPQMDAALPTPSPTPTVACPEMPGVELPAECAPYDPEHSMAQNDAYRERMEIDEADRASGQEIVPAVAAALGELRDAAEVTVDSVRAALTAAGLHEPQVRADYEAVLFGAGGPTGGCVFGEVSPRGVTVEVGGYIADGGCLPAQ